MVVCIDPNSTIGRIDPKLHGQFIEFLGECIDEGLWVGEDSPIENEHGYRKAPRRHANGRCLRSNRQANE